MKRINELFWGDSTLEQVVIEYDKITVKVFNDITEKIVYIECLNCIGMTNLYIWDETIIDNIVLDEIMPNSHEMWKKIYEAYGDESYDLNKNLRGKFYELTIKMINDLEFSIICKDVKLID